MARIAARGFWSQLRVLARSARLCLAAVMLLASGGVAQAQMVKGEASFSASGGYARLLFKLEDLVFGPARTLPKFRARELIARTPYQSWEQVAYLKAGQRGNGRSRAEKLFRTVNEDRAEQDNEEWHIILLEEQIATSGVHVNPIRFRLLPQLIAFAVYQQFWLLRVLKPVWSYRLNADIEDHAEYEYAALVAEHPEWETIPFRSAVAAGYGSYDSLADMFRQIGCDEGVHKEISLARMIIPAARA